MRLRYTADEGEYREALAVLAELLSPGDAAREGLVEVQRLEDLGGPVVDSWFAKSLRESGRKERAEGRREGRREAEAPARREQRATLVRLARRKFGVETGKKLAALLEGVSDPDRLAEIADLIIDCSSGPELLGKTDV